ncbi:MAG: TrkH family potassium uptake protein [Candidatus Aenigmarchaeota archaeon]|nr:TrkH family potassium uptake protein [Candidatus Aenigmarchaeota archaeon]
MDTKVIFKALGTTLKYASFVFLVPIIVAVIYGEYFAIPYFFLGFLVALVLGFVLERIFYTEKETRLSEGMIIIAMIWLVVTLISTIPFVFAGGMPFIDAFFESMSAWTTTGFSLLNLEQAPQSILFWKSFVQWVGGIGIVVLALSGLFKTGNTLYIIEGHERIRPNVINSVKTIWWIYIFYTIIGISLLFIAGMPLFDSVNHAMTGIATGGMGTHSESIGFYNSEAIEGVMMLIMLLGAISFFSHYQLIAGKRRKFFRDIQTITLVILIVVITLLLLPFHFLRETLFHVVSAVTCSGFHIQGLIGWSDYSKSLLIMLMIFGGAAGSTVGGLKLNRILIFFKSIYDNIKKLLKPRLVFPRRIGSIIYTEKEFQAIFKFIGIYIFFLVVGSFILMSQGYPAINSLFQVASAQGNVGLSVISELSIISKITLIFNMWIGRLEIWAVLVFIIYILRRK